MVKKVERQWLTIKKVCHNIFDINFWSIGFIICFIFLFFNSYLHISKQYNLPIHVSMLDIGIGQKLGGRHVASFPTPTPKPSPTPTPTPAP